MRTSISSRSRARGLQRLPRLKYYNVVELKPMCRSCWHGSLPPMSHGSIITIPLWKTNHLSGCIKVSCDQRKCSSRKVLVRSYECTCLKNIGYTIATLLAYDLVWRLGRHKQGPRRRPNLEKLNFVFNFGTFFSIFRGNTCSDCSGSIIKNYWL